ncbi:MAG: hypothetical protein NTX01_01330 [Candidatus Omnitrophica bacterium]|nr:hypothetical protein [Candidatus Omnitrophota bacterium]
MDNKIKKIIAREGLIFLSLLMFGLILLFFENYLYSRPIDLLARPQETHANFNGIRLAGLFFLYLGYPFYLLTRFIIWAIRVLKKK